MPRNRPSCPRCGGHDVARFLYGLPDLNVLREALRNKTITLGGCCVTDNDPRWRCNACGTDFGFPKGKPSQQRAPEP